MNILQVSWYKVLPAITGGQKGIIGLYNALQQSHRVTLVCSSDNVSTNQNVLAVLPKGKLQLLQWKSYLVIKQQIRKQQPKVVIIEHPYYFLLALYKKKYNFQLVVHTHNIEYKRLRLLGKWYWPLVKLVEHLAYKKADEILCKTKEDKRLIQKKFNISTNKIAVLPYCIKEEIPFIKKQDKITTLQEKYKLTADTTILLFAASFDYKPNQEGLLHLINDIIPALQKLPTKPYHILICGTLLEDFIKENNMVVPAYCTMVGFVEDIAFHFAGAHLFINPVRYGEGVQTKTMDALAHHCSVVMYHSVSNGIDKNATSDKLQVVNTSNEFTAAIQNKIDMEVAPTSPTFFKVYNWETYTTKLFVS